MIAGIVLVVLGIVSILTPTIAAQLKSESLPPNCYIHPCLQVPQSPLVGYVWLLGIALFTLGLIFIARSREVTLSPELKRSNFSSDNETEPTTVGFSQGKYWQSINWLVSQSIDQSINLFTYYKRDQRITDNTWIARNHLFSYNYLLKTRGYPPRGRSDGS